MKIYLLVETLHWAIRQVESLFPVQYTGWRKKKLTCLIYFNLKTKRAITPKLRALHSVLSNLNFDIRPVQFRAILTERAAFKLE
jgi:hypothetical protein